MLTESLLRIFFSLTNLDFSMQAKFVAKATEIDFSCRDTFTSLKARISLTAA